MVSENVSWSEYSLLVSTETDTEMGGRNFPYKVNLLSHPSSVIFINIQ